VVSGTKQIFIGNKVPLKPKIYYIKKEAE